MGDDLLRPAFGNTELGKFADNVEETLPTLAPVLDLVFGVRPEPKKGHDAAWWAEQRPRPYRGPTADPSGPAKERAAYMIKFEEEKRRLAKEAREGKRAAQAAAQMAAEASRATFETKAKVEAELNRIGFFGRPVQKQRLLKRERQVRPGGLRCGGGQREEVRKDGWVSRCNREWRRKGEKGEIAISID
jgi:hypothetical protein